MKEYKVSLNNSHFIQKNAPGILIPGAALFHIQLILIHPTNLHGFL